MNRGQTTATADTPVVTLRKLITIHFSDAELQTLAHDLGVDYEELAGDTKSSKTIQLIQIVARRGKIVDLVESCRRERPDVDWNAVGIAAATNPNQFLFVPDESKPLLNASPDRALRLGVVLGVVMVLLLGCGFGGGLLAGQVVSVTVNPVQPERSSLEKVRIKVGNRVTTPQQEGVSFAQILQALTNGSLPAGTPVAIQLNDTQATTIADQLVTSQPDAPISDVHVRFLRTGEAVVNLRAKALGGRRIALAYTARAEGGQIILTPSSVNVNVIEVPNTTFGWVPVPTSTVDDVTRWAQTQLNNASRNLWFTDVLLEEDSLTLVGMTR